MNEYSILGASDSILLLHGIVMLMLFNNVLIYSSQTHFRFQAHWFQIIFRLLKIWCNVFPLNNNFPFDLQ